MADNDFLSQFSSNNKPDSFKEEERIPIKKEPKKINPKLVIIVSSILVVVAAILVIVFVLPHIKVENFVGSPKEDVVAWLKQQEIETNGIVFKEEYNFDFDKDIVISQDPDEGKVRKKAIMTFVISSGPDPEESIVVPDLQSMDKEEINNWIKTNKLLSTKINTAYDDTVPADNFIEAKYSGCDADSFTRGCSLKISISKGKKPEDEITMANFVKKTYAEFESWADGKKLKLNKTEVYSDTVDAGIVISQSVKENETVKVGDTINVSVSKGKGVKVPDFTKMVDSEIDSWLTDNAAFVKVKKRHYESDAYVIEQSIQTGQYIGTDNIMNITVNLGSHFYIDELNFSIVGGSYDKFKDMSVKWLEDLGINIDTHRDYVDSDKPEGTILNIKSIYSGNDVYSEVQRLPLNVDIRVEVSNGKENESELFVFPAENYYYQRLGNLFDYENIDKLKIKYVDENDKPIIPDPNLYVIEIIYKDNPTTEIANLYLKNGEELKIKLSKTNPKGDKD